MNDVVLVSAARTPFGRLGGALKDIPATALGGVAIRSAVERAGIAPSQVDHLIMGNVISAGLGQVPSRQAGFDAGLPSSVPSFTVNKVCASSLKAVNLAAMLIMSGEAEVVVAGGMESMSNAPYLLHKHRFGTRMGDDVLRDSMILDGLCCPIDNLHMGVHGGRVAAEQNISREEQDAFALASQERYAAALSKGYLEDELVAVPTGKVPVTADEQPRPETTAEKLASLKPIFEETASVTAGNAPGVNDGASAIVLMSKDRAKAEGREALATWVACGNSADEHPYLSTVPALAIRDAVRKTSGGVSMEDISLYEINEAFAAVAIHSMRMLELSSDVVNVNGGAIAIGHPIGASGARILMTLMFELRRRGGGIGAAGICSGLAQGEATLLRVG